MASIDATSRPVEPRPVSPPARETRARSTAEADAPSATTDVPHRPLVRRFRDLSLFNKVLVPFFVLMLLVALLGAFLIVRDLSSRALATVDRDLTRLSLDVASSIATQELSLLESANFAANLEGMAEAIQRRDRRTVRRLLQSVLALKTDVTLLAAIDRRGAGVIEFVRNAPGGDPDLARPTPWTREPFIRETLDDRAGSRRAGLVAGRRSPSLVIAAPVCSGLERCSPVGAAIVGFRLEEVMRRAFVGFAGAGHSVSIGVHGPDGGLLSSRGEQRLPPTAPETVGDQPVRRTMRLDGEATAILYSPLRVEGLRTGTLAVAMPTAPAFSSVRGAALRLAWIFLAAMAGVVAVGALLSRFILRQVKPLVATNRALGEGDLSARAPVFGNDELGELATGVNQMAEQLQASHENLEQRVAERTEEVQRLLKERTEFFAGLSHELRTPLFVIQGHAEMLADPSSPRGTAWRTEVGRTIAEASQHLVRVVNDILELAKGGTVDLDLAPVRLRHVVEEIEPTIRGLVEAADLDVELDIPDDLPTVRADRSRVRDILVNLLDNAVKYTPRGGRIEVSAARENGHVRVSVADTGVGIPADVGKRIFEPFYRVKGVTPHRGQPSSGLGLALAKRLVEAHGGEISFHARAGGGTTFMFTLPVARRKKPHT